MKINEQLDPSSTYHDDCTVIDARIDDQGDHPFVNSSSLPNMNAEYSDIQYIQYENEHQLKEMTALIENDLSEPYSIYTYRYFLHQHPQLSFLAIHKNNMNHHHENETKVIGNQRVVGVIICKLDHHKNRQRGYIGMLAVSDHYRKRGIGSRLVQMAIDAMAKEGVHEIVLDTEVTNRGALALYERLGFIREKRLAQYYLNGADAYRLKLWL